MKKIIALILALTTIVLCFAGCAPKDIRGEVTPAEQSGEAAEEQSGEAAAEDNTADTTEADASGDAAAEAEEEPFEFGANTADKYENKYFGIGFQAEGWTFQTEEELEKENGITKDLVDEKTAEALENSTVVTDMFAASPDSTQNVNITIQKLNTAQSMLVDEKTYAEASIEEVKAAIEGMGAENITSAVTEAQLCGETHPAIELSYVYMNLELKQIAVIMKKGSYIATITSTVYGGGGAEEALANFYSL